MIRVWLLLALLAIGAEAAAEPIVLEQGQTVTRPAPGATAAYALNTTHVVAGVRDGELVLLGRLPGTTHVIVVRPEGLEHVLVTVRESALSRARRAAAVQSGPVDAGAIEARYVSNPGLYQGTLQFSRRDGDRETDVSLGGALAAGRADSSLVSIPIARYTLRTPRREITFFDRLISNSPLTVQHATVRGVHLREGPFRLHAGYNFYANFQDVLLPVDQQSLGGVSYTFPAGRHATLTPNVYYINSPRAGRSGGIASMAYEVRRGESLRLLAEVGMSSVPAGAAEFTWSAPTQRAWSRVRFVPQEVPTVGNASPAGRLIDAGWNKEINRATLSVNLASHRYDIGPVTQGSTVASAAVYYRIGRWWRVHTAPGVSTFGSSRAGRDSEIRTLTLPVGVALATRHVGASAEYQFSRETNRNLGGHLVRLGTTGMARGFHYSLTAERQTQAPSVGFVLSEVPWLQQALETLGITAATPQDLSEALRTNAALAALGYTGIADVTLTPQRSRLVASGGWTGEGVSRPSLWVSSMLNTDTLVWQRATSAVHTTTYSQRASRSADVYATWSVLCAGSSRGCQSVVSLSWRHHLGSVPGLLLPGRRGDIRGVVFRDDLAAGHYREGMPGLAGIEVVLDGTTHTRTDAHGRYRFLDVPAGPHRIEVRHPGDQPFFFTTPSPTEATIGNTVNFGVGFLLSRVRGVVTDDSGAPLPGIALQLARHDRTERTWTEGDGTFSFDGLHPGEYQVAVDTASVPPGYRLRDLKPVTVSTRAGEPTRVSYVITAQRAVSGVVRRLDAQSGGYVPVAAALVELQGGSARVVTDRDGKYILRDLGPGEHRLLATHDGAGAETVITLPKGPAMLQQVSITLAPARASGD
jgi:hypothetical protein